MWDRILKEFVLQLLMSFPILFRQAVVSIECLTELVIDHSKFLLFCKKL